jgi:dihydropyrimidinase
MLDIVITGGTAVLPSGAHPADIGVAGEKIVAIGAPGSLAAIGAKAHRRRGRPGRDPRRHRSACPLPLADADAGPDPANLTDGPDRVSQAALHGGTTTILDFALVDGDNTVQQAIERRQKEWAGDCACDYAFHTMVQGKLDWSIPDQLAEAVAAGPSDGQDVHHRHHPVAQGPHGPVRQHHGGAEGAGARPGGLAAIHAEDNDLVMHMYEKLIREGAPASTTWPRSQHHAPRIWRSTG